MKLELISKTYNITKNKQPYITLNFKYLDTGKEVTYNIWGFVHQKEQDLIHIWEAAQKAVVGQKFIVHFQKVEVQEQLQFIVTCLKRL